MATNKVYFQQAGTARYTKINGNPDVYKDPLTGITSNPCYSILIDVTEEEYVNFQNYVNKVWQNSEEFKKVQAKGKSGLEPTMGGIREFTDKNGIKHYTIKAKTAVEFIDRNTQEVRKNVVKLYDGKRNRLPDDTQIPFGSDVVVNIMLSPYISPMGLYGISLKLSGIQIVKVAGGMSANGCPFESVDGAEDLTENTYIAPSEPVTQSSHTQEIPF